MNQAASPMMDDTCRELFSLVLQISALDPALQPPNKVVASLRELASRDEALATCFQSQHPVDWDAIAQRLPELLVQLDTLSSSSHDSPSRDLADPISSHDSPSREQSQLLSLCHVVIRQRTLEANFATELQRQKMEAIYQFAYGLSHELNNPLANIATRAGVLASNEAHPDHRQLLENIVTNAMRGCEMLGDLMLVARPPKLQFETTRIDQLLDRVVARGQLWATPLNVALRIEQHTQRSIEADASALTEALWAIIRNAIEAMPDGGEVCVALSDTRHARNRDTNSQPAPTAVCIEVADQGSGLSAQALEHCFDPYYSGREAGRGLGLGLSKAMRIVVLHGGELNLSNRPGGGCLARIVIPLSGREKVSDTKSAKHPKGRSGFWCPTPFPRQPKN